MELAEPKALPHSEESERAVLAAALIDHERYLPIAAARLVVDDFYFERHQRLYSSMLELQAATALAIAAKPMQRQAFADDLAD